MNKSVKKSYVSIIISLTMLMSIMPQFSIANAASRVVITQVKQYGNKQIVKVNWKKSSNSSKYFIYRSNKKSKGYSKLGSVAGSKRKLVFKDNTVKYGRTYYYKIKAKGMKFSKIMKVTVEKSKSIDNCTAVPAQMTPTLGVSTLNPAVTNSPAASLTPAVSSTPAPTIDPSTIVNMESFGTENKDYYIISDKGRSEDINAVAEINEGIISVRKSTTIVFMGNISNYLVQCAEDNLNVNIILYDAAITNSTVPFINNEKASSVISLAALGQSVNSITASSDYTGVTEIINSKGNIIYSGGGTININSLASEFNSVKSEASIELKSGIVNVNSGKNGIVSDNAVTISGGSITLKASGKGIKAGYVNVTDGVIDITSGDHGISASGNLVAGNADDNDNAISITGGHVTIKATATLTTSTKSGDMMGGTRTVYDATGGDGLNSNSGIVISNADIKVIECADAIQAESNLSIKDSILDLFAFGKGLKSGYTVDTSYYGALTVDGGEIDITAYDDTIHCNNNVNVSAGTLTLSTSDDGIHANNDLVIGKENAKDSDLTLTVLPSTAENVILSPYEGIEAAYIYVYSGTISVDTQDDGFNAAGGVDSSGSNTGTTGSTEKFGPGGGQGGMPQPGGGMMSSSYGEIFIYGSNIHIDADGDSLDANGKLTIEGGYVLIDGSANGADDVLDYDSGCYINGGTVIAVGRKGVSTEGGSSASIQKNILFTSSTNTTAGADYKIKDSDGNVILTGTTKKATNVYFFTSEKFSEGTYSLYINDIKKSDVTFNASDICKTVSF